MNLYVAIYGGASLLVILSIWSKLHTKIFFSPAVIFFIAFFVHTCVDPLLRIQSGLFATEETIKFAANYNFLCIVAVFLGYMIASTMLPATKRVESIESEITVQGFYILFGIAISLAVLSFMLHYSSGAIGNSRAEFAGYGAKPLTYTLAKFIKTNVALISVYLITLSIFDRKFFSFQTRVIAALPAIIIALSEALAFGRQWTMALVLTLIIIIIARKKKINSTTIAFGIGLMAAITFVGMLRKFNVGFFTILSGGVNLAEKVDFNTFLYFLVTTIPGQEVFLNVIDKSNSYDLFNGSTYFWNFTSRFGLGFLQPADYLTPSAWYAAHILPNSNYGRDFSMIAESYINFRMHGAWIFFLFGVALSYLNRKVLTSTNLLMVCWAAYMVVNMVISLRNDSLPVFTRALYSPIPLLLFFTTYNLLAQNFPKRYRLI